MSQELAPLWELDLTDPNTEYDAASMVVRDRRSNETYGLCGREWMTQEHHAPEPAAAEQVRVRSAERPSVGVWRKVDE